MKTINVGLQNNDGTGDPLRSAFIKTNENFERLSHGGVYARNPDVSNGLTFGYYGGRYSGILISDGVLALTANAINYIVVSRSTGAISVSDNVINWNDVAAYARVYKVVTGATSVTTIQDFRNGENGVHGYMYADPNIQLRIDYDAISQSILVRDYTLQNKTTGTLNIALGVDALLSTTTASNNIAIGKDAGRSIISGSGNTIIGSLNGTDTLADTVLIGAGSTERIKVDSTGLYINGVPFAGALDYDDTTKNFWTKQSSNLGTWNTLIGVSSGTSISTGNHNIFIGSTSGNLITTGSNNTIIGELQGTSTLSDTVLIAAGSTQRVKVDSDGLFVNADPVRISSTYSVINSTGTAYTVSLVDAGNVVLLDNVGVITITLDADSDIPVGAHIDFVQYGIGQCVFVGNGVTLKYTPGNKTRAQYSGVSCIKTGVGEWLLIGDLVE